MGIYGFQWDSRNGTIGNIRSAGAAASNPSYLAVHPSGRFLYAVNEDAGPGSDTLSAFAIVDQNSAKSLRFLGAVDSQGRAPCHLSLDVTGRWLFAANYFSGTIAVFPIQTDGQIGAHIQTIQQLGSGPVRQRQQAAHAHEVLLSPDGRFLLAADLGSDRIFVYRFDAQSGALTPNSPSAATLPAGYGPRHFVFSEDGTRVYVVAELAAMLMTFRWDADHGILTPVAAISTLPPHFKGRRNAAEIALQPSGRFLYVSNRGDSDSIGIFRLRAGGVPVYIGAVSSGGKGPRFIVIDPSDHYLIAANQDSGTLITFRMNRKSGMLSPVHRPVLVPAPVDLVFNPAAPK